MDVGCSLCNQTDYKHALKDERVNVSPISLRNLIPAGVLPILIRDDEHNAISQLCEHPATEDGWHTFIPIPTQLEKYEDLLKSLNFLVMQEFISLSFRRTESHLVIRVYLVPFDLPGVKGRFRLNQRKKAVLSAAKPYLTRLLGMLNSDPLAWQGNVGLNSNQLGLFTDVNDNRTLSMLYDELSSPQPEPTPQHPISERLLDFSDSLDGLGIRSSLYEYQRRSVALMISREQERLIADPAYLQITSPTGDHWYIQPGNVEILRERPMISGAKGGILCEELGTGKTVITLALIMATRKQLSTPEESILHPHVTMTPLSFRHFPGSDFEAARWHVPKVIMKSVPTSTVRVPSFREAILHKMATEPVSDVPDLCSRKGIYQEQRHQRILAKSEGVQDRYSNAMKANIPFYYHHDHAAPPVRHADRDKVIPRKIYLTSATLVVVPHNILSQWEREINKHCSSSQVDDGSGLRILILRTKTKIPPAAELAADYDIVLMTYTKFTGENNAREESRRTWDVCKCPDFEDVRIPNCKCQPNTKISPLLQVRWKRLVIDEGHVSGSMDSTMVDFARHLSVERRWIVTGTPAKNLLGLSLGKASVATTDGMEGSDKDESDRSTPSHGSPTDIFDSNPLAEDSQGSRSSSTENQEERIRSPQSRRRWTASERADLRHFLNMITRFLGMKTFLTDPTLPINGIARPLFDPSGPLPGSVQVLEQLMQATMIRHRAEDVEQYVRLPPLVHEPILLDLHPVSIKSYNALQAAIAVNAVDSERKDQDYMFHSSNTESLRLTIKNMFQILFWAADEGLHNADELLRGQENTLRRARARQRPLEDFELLDSAFRHIRMAAEDRFWRESQLDPHIPIEVSHLNIDMINAWSRFERSNLHNMHIDRLVDLRHAVVAHPLNTEIQKELGAAVATQDWIIHYEFMSKDPEIQLDKRKSGRLEALNASKEAAKAYREANAALRVEMGERLEASRLRLEALRCNRMGMQLLRIPQSLPKSTKTSVKEKASLVTAVKEMQQDLHLTLQRLEAEAEAEDRSSSTPPTPQLPSPTKPSRLLYSSSIANTRCGPTLSSKLNYILEQVLQHSSREKFLIFSDSGLTLAHIADALTLAEVRHLKFTTDVIPEIREQFVLTFETSETYRVFLMELKHGARGLNLISASRVIFCEPVWHADVESQAIKRTHRIGQTKPIHVSTLIIRNTVEETMWTRRRELQSKTAAPLPRHISDETGIRHFIENPKFLEEQPTLLPSVSFPLVNLGHDSDGDYDDVDEVALSANSTTNEQVIHVVSPRSSRLGVTSPEGTSTTKLTITLPSPSDPKRRKIQFALLPSVSHG